ncbi:reverse transcriptase domain-containing protein [Tanacetum coccineum]
MEELCQPTMNRRGEPIAPVNIQATDFGLKNHMIQQVQNSCQFHGLPGDDANKHLDKFLTITQSMKQNGVTDDALRLYLFPYSLTHHATDCLNRGESSSSITSSSEIAALAQQMVEIRKDMLQMYHSSQQVNSVTPSCETYGGPHSYYECQAAGGYTQDVYATTKNYNAGGNSYQPQGYNQNINQNFNQGDNYNQNQGQNYNQNIPQLTHPSTDEMLRNFMISSEAKFNPLATSMIEIKKSLQERPQGALPSNTIPNPREEIKAITIRSGNVLAGPSVPLPPISSSSREVERDPETITNQMFKKLHFNISLAEALALMPKYAKMLKDLLSDKEKLLGLENTSLTKNCSAVLLKKLPEKLGDPEKFLIPCDFLELEKCIALANLAGIAEDVCTQVGKFTFYADFVVVDYDVDPRVPFILGRPFLRMARALVDVYGEELIPRDGDEKLIFHVDSTSKHPHKHENESINMINFIDITCEDCFQEVLKIKKSNHPFSGSSDSFPSLTPVKTSDSLLEEFIDELALLDPFLSGNEDDNFDPEDDLREIEYLLNRDPSTDSSPKTDIDIIDPILERFTDEPALVYSFPPGDDDDDLFDFENDNDEWRNILYHDPFDDIHSEKDKIKDSKMKILIDELESPESNALLPQLLECDSTLHEKFPKNDTLPSFLSENEDKVFNLGTLIHGSTYFITNKVAHDKNLKEKTSSEALLILEDSNSLSLSLSFDRELLFHLELTVTETLLSFSSENEDKVFNPGILILEGVHSLTLGVSHRTYETFKIVNVHPNILNEGPMKIFPFFCFCPKDKGIREDSS